MKMGQNGNNLEQENICECCRAKHTPRSEKELKQLQNRLNRIVGQLNGIGRMLDENRYCGDILSFGHIVLARHMETCVVEEIRKGNEQIMEEVVELVKKLK